MAGPPGGPRQRTSDSKQALYDALQGAVQSERERPPASGGARPGDRSGRRLMWGSLAVLAVVLAWLGVTRPDWLIPAPPKPHSIEFQDASLRMLLYMEARRIENYRQANGELPTSLGEVGVVPDGVTYTTFPDGTFRLEGRTEGLRITFTSTDSVAAFLKNSFEVLSRREARP